MGPTTDANGVETTSCPFCGCPRDEMHGTTLPSHMRNECEALNDKRQQIQRERAKNGR